MANPIRILIADDHGIVRQALSRLLEEEPDMEVVAECTNGIEAINWLSTNECDVALIDIAMPRMNGIDLLNKLRQEKCKVPVLILSTYAEGQYAARLMKAGASGYLTKECAPLEIVEAVKSVARGHKYFSQELLNALVKQGCDECGKFPHETLSDREYQIFLLLATANTVSEIANNLQLSVKTVSTYRSRILEKMRLRNNYELMRYATENNLALHSLSDTLKR